MEFYRPEGAIRGFYHFYPGVVAVVGVEAERVNFMPAVWNTGLSASPPLFGVSVSPKRYTHGLLQKARRFSASFHPKDQAGLIQRLGSLSGREVDKVQALGLAYFLGETGVPILEGAYAAYELSLVAVYPLGDHDLFVGQVVGVWEDRRMLDEKNRPLFPLLYYGGGLYGEAGATFVP